MNYNDSVKIISYFLSEFENNRSICDIDSLDTVNWEKQYYFFIEHAIVSIASDFLKYIPDEYSNIKIEWQKSVFSNVYSYTQLVKHQKRILEYFTQYGIPVVVIKGSSVAKYYPRPQYRTFGDIDLLVRPKDYEKAVKCLVENGCLGIKGKFEEKRERHSIFHYKGVSIELHRYFSSYGIGKKDNVLDNLLFDAISQTSTVLPDVENGLVLLSHIRQHLEGGLGLRQIIDWFLFVRSCLNDEMWYSSFQEKARLTGLELLAITVTRMCQIHFGLTTENITWCKYADEVVCDELLQYVIGCGNFGRSRELIQSGSTSKLPSINHPIELFKYIQSHGEMNWKVLKKHPSFKPFAWIYQTCRYIKLAFQNKITPNKLKSIYEEGEKRNKMFSALGLKKGKNNT